MNAIELLETQHEVVMSMLKKLEESDASGERTLLFKKMRSSLLAHMVIEEEQFYAAAAEAQPDRETIAEAYEEHAGARSSIERCAKALADDELFRVRVCVLRELIEHHVEEERTAVFPEVQKRMSVEQLEALGAQMEARYAKAQKQADAAARLNRLSTQREKQALSP